jgi:hypothetical protein
MSKVSLRFLLRISLTLLLNPATFAKSFSFIPIYSIRNLMASIGSGIPIGKYSFSYRSIKIDRISSSSPFSLPFFASKISSSRLSQMYLILFFLWSEGRNGCGSDALSKSIYFTSQITIKPHMFEK